MSDDDFIEVKYKDNRKNQRGSYSSNRGRGRPPRRAQPNLRFHAQHLTSEKISNVEEEVVKGKERILECLQELQKSSYFSRIQDHLIRCEKKQNILDIVCYGIGSFHNSKKCRYQFALLLAVRNFLEIAPEHVYIFDPVLNEVDRAIIAHYKMNIIKENEMCKRKANEKTLFYMPHCGKQLYSNLLWANWSSRLLQNVVLFGNSFSMYKAEVNTKNKAIYVYRVLPFIHEFQLQDSFETSGIFNDLSIHQFKAKHLNELKDDFWQQHEEEQIDETDPEINRNNFE